MFLSGFHAKVAFAVLADHIRADLASHIVFTLAKDRDSRRARRCLRVHCPASRETRSRPGTAEAAEETDRHGNVCEHPPRLCMAVWRP